MIDKKLIPYQPDTVSTEPIDAVMAICEDDESPGWREVRPRARRLWNEIAELQTEWEASHTAAIGEHERAEEARASLIAVSAERDKLRAEVPRLVKVSGPLISAVEIQRLRLLDAQAHPAPWRTPAAPGPGHVFGSGMRWSTDAELGAAARNALPRLLEERDGYRAMLKTLEWLGPGDRCPLCHVEHGERHTHGCALAVMMDFPRRAK